MGNDRMADFDAAKSIRALMEMHNLSEFRFSEITGLSQPSVSNWLLHKSVPGTRSILKICGAFRITMGEFQRLGLPPENNEEKNQESEQRKDPEKERLLSLWEKIPENEQSVMMKCLEALAVDG